MNPKRASLIATSMAVVWTLLVRLGLPHFWIWSPLYCAVWLAITFRAIEALNKHLLKPSRGGIGWGLGMGVFLYLGSRIFLGAFCGGFSRILCRPLGEIYTRFETRNLAAALALTLVIAPAEELFWRGWVQSRVLKWMVGKRPGSHSARAISVVITALLSSSLLAATGDFLLALAAFPTSLVWGGLTAYRKSVVPAIVSHSLWDLLIAVLLPPIS